MIPHYVIHCAELPDRAAAARAHLTQHVPHGKLTFFRGFHGKTWGLDTTREYEPGLRISPGHVGLLLGHWSLWNHLHTNWEKPYPSDPRHDTPVCVLEDDAVLPDGWAGKLDGVLDDLAALVPDWQLCFVGLAETEPHVWHKVTDRVGGPDSRLCRLNDPFGTHAYLVRRSALPGLLDNMTAAERNMDQQLYQRVLKPGRLVWCAVLPTLVEQRTFDHRLRGRPEWAPSTIDPDAPRPVVERLHAGDAREIAGPPRDAGDTPGDPSPKRYAMTAPLIDPLPCIYRGEFLEEHGRTAAGRSVPRSLCAKLYTACHSRRGAAVTNPDGTPCTPCEPCPHRAEMSAGSARPKLPLPEGHFNPSMIVWRGRLILATRDSWGHSKVALWELKNRARDWSADWSATPIGSFGSDHPEAPRLEDPRLFTVPDGSGGDQLCCMFNLPDGYPPKLVQVGYARFARDLSGIVETRVFASPHGNLYEKNWVPFHDGRELRWVYSTTPEHVVMGETDTHATPNPLPWTGGVVRGGAAPVLCADGHPEWPLSWADRPARPVYYHFFHGCLKRVQGSVYTVGCAVFEAEPPFRVLRQTAAPLAWPDLPAHGENVVKRYVLWPGGAVPHAGAWHLACGIDDTNCRIIRLPFEAVEAAFTDRADTEPGVSIRDTPLARGSNR